MDWFNDGGSLAAQPAGVTRYYLIDGLDRVNNDGSGVNAGNGPTIFGLAFDIDETRTLSSITIAKTSQSGALSLFGGVGVTIPEPASLALLTLGAAAMLRRRG